MIMNLAFGVYTLLCIVIGYNWGIKSKSFETIKPVKVAAETIKESVKDTASFVGLEGKEARELKKKQDEIKRVWNNINNA